MKEFFQSRSNFLSFAVALIPCWLLYIFEPGVPVKYIYFAFAVIISLFLLWLFVMYFLDCKSLRYELAHKVVPYTFKILSHGKDICLCESNYQLPQDSIISFYLQRDGFEYLIGYGIVLNVQMDGKIQISPYPLDNAAERIEKSGFPKYLSDNRNNVIIKPVITIKSLENVLNIIERNNQYE